MNNFFMRRLIGCGVVLAIVAVIGIGMAIYEGVVSVMHSNFAAPFKPQMAAYLAAPKGPAAAGPVKGKMIVLDKAKQDIDYDITYDLPADLKAVKPAEVGTVVQIDWIQKLEPNYTYGPGTSAYRQNAAVMVIDLASQTVIAKNDFAGGDPPNSIGQHDSQGVGPKPIKEVADYLKGLPRQ